MSSSRASFLSGVVLGLALGLVLGHFTLWRPQPAPGEIHLGQPIRYGPPPAVPYDLTFTERSAFPDPGDDEDPAEWLPSPLANAIAIRVADESATIGGTSPSRREPRRPAELTPVDQPQPLEIPGGTEAPQSAPPPRARINVRDEQFIRELIEIELPEASPEEREVWFDSLKDLHKEEVSGVLRMWKRFGDPASELFKSTGPSTPLKGAEARNSTGWSELLREAREVHLQNIRMANSPGYRRRFPRFIERPGETGAVAAGVAAETLFHPGPHGVTGNPLDCVILGNGMFVVEDGEGRRFYTRRGRFTIGSGRRLVLRDGERELEVVPGFTIPGEIAGIGIQRDGRLNVLKPDSETPEELGRIRLAVVLAPDILEQVANGLFRVDEQAAQGRILVVPPGTAGAGLLETGKLESSNVNVAAEWNEVEQLQRLLDAQ